MTRPQVLRPYQNDAITGLRAAMRAQIRRILLVSPTGSGKTTISSEIIHKATSANRQIRKSDGTKRSQRVLFLAHRKELIDQCSARLDSFGVDHGVIKASHPRNMPWLDVQVASVQTLLNRLRAMDVDGPRPEEFEFDLIIIDEAHRARAKTYNSILEFFEKAVVLGLTATPWRSDGKGLGELFHELVLASTPEELIKEGYLVEYTGFVYDQPDYSGMRKSKDDGYNLDDQATRAREKQILGRVVDQWVEHANNELTIVFACNVEHSKELAAEFVAAGIAAEHCDGEMKTDEREAILGPEGRFPRGETRVICNVALLTEGYDVPAVSCIILTRYTESVSLALQMVGRGMRPIPCDCGTNFDPKLKDGCPSCGAKAKKRYARIHDHAGILFRHGPPDAERDYSLTADENHSGRKRKEKEEANQLRQCLTSKSGPGCYRVFPRSLNECPGCGKSVDLAPAQIVQVDAKGIPISEISHVSDQKKKAAWKSYSEKAKGLRVKGREPKAAAKAAAAMFKSQFNHWPTWGWVMKLERELKFIKPNAKGES